jgi:IS30 family transposase
LANLTESLFRGKFIREYLPKGINLATVTDLGIQGI